MKIGSKKIENQFKIKVITEVHTENEGTRIYCKFIDEPFYLNDYPLIFMKDWKPRNINWYIYVNGIYVYNISYYGIYINPNEFTKNNDLKSIPLFPNENGCIALKNIYMKGVQIFIE